MTSMLLHSIDLLATMVGEEISNGAIAVENGWITAVGPTHEMEGDWDERVDLTGHVVLPGLINTHHHLWQMTARAVPAAQNATLLPWLKALFPIWKELSPVHLQVASRLGAAELALSGCTTTADHQYLWPNGSSIDDLIEGIDPVGIRAHLARGTITFGESEGALPPDQLTEPEGVALAALDKAAADHHDTSPGAKFRIVFGPAAPFSVGPSLLADGAALARESDIRLHTHLAETPGENQASLTAYGMSTLERLTSLGWVASDVWFAHCIHLKGSEMDLLASQGAGVAHCPTSNMRLGSGIAPLQSMLDAGVKVGIGVDGSASNDSSDLLDEARHALFASRLLGSLAGEESPCRLTARKVLKLATIGGADVLGRDDIGALEPGKAADIVAYDLSDPRLAGSHDPLAALIFCRPAAVAHSWVQGRRIVENGQLCNVDLGQVASQHRRLVADLPV